MKKFIYLVGPVTDCDDGEANDWRDIVTKSLHHRNLVCVSPLRNEPKITGRYPVSGGEFLFNTPKAIATKNSFDTDMCDLVLGYLPKKYNDRRPSYGTVFELAWATWEQKPTILVTDDPAIINHPLFAEKIDWIVESFEEAIELIHGLLDVYAVD